MNYGTTLNVEAHLDLLEFFSTLGVISEEQEYFQRLTDMQVLEKGIRNNGCAT